MPLAAEHFYIRLEPVRKDFKPDNATAEEKRIIGEHFEYLKGLLASGNLILAGPVQDPKQLFGVLILEAPSAGHAREMMLNDPTVKHKVFRGEMAPMSVALIRGGN